jgi:hypothetical protein
MAPRVERAAAFEQTATEALHRAGLDQGVRGYRRPVNTERLDELRRRLAERADQGSTNDRVTTARLARMRRRLSALEHISENTIDEAVAMSAEEEVLEIMDSLENVRELRSSDDG